MLFSDTSWRVQFRQNAERLFQKGETVRKDAQQNGANGDRNHAGLKLYIRDHMCRQSGIRIVGPPLEGSHHHHHDNEDHCNGGDFIRNPIDFRRFPGIVFFERFLPAPIDVMEYSK